MEDGEILVIVAGVVRPHFITCENVVDPIAASCCNTQVEYSTSGDLLWISMYHKSNETIEILCICIWCALAFFVRRSLRVNCDF